MLRKPVLPKGILVSKWLRRSIEKGKEYGVVLSQTNKALVPKSPGSAQERGHVGPLVV